MERTKVIQCLRSFNTDLEPTPSGPENYLRLYAKRTHNGRNRILITVTKTDVCIEVEPIRYVLNASFLPSCYRKYLDANNVPYDVGATNPTAYIVLPLKDVEPEDLYNILYLVWEIKN